ncbi:MAG TPA: hypothetical protein DC017_07180, partial [Candidatus Wallbacteria bacterium]|nr:hypothetical protein [Candidatus Wallbacteria bacterium]
LPALSFAVFAVLYFSNLSVYLINFSYDAFTNLRSTEKKNDRVIIIGVDDASLQKYDKTRTGVLSKTLYSRLLDQMSFYSPAALAFDVIFELRGEGTDESDLLSAVSRYKREIIFSSYFKTEFDFSKPVDIYVEPLRAPDAPPNLTYGCVNIFRGVSGDHDGVKRRYRPVIAGGTQQADRSIGATVSVQINSLPAAVMSALYSMKRSDDQERIDFFEKDSTQPHSSVALDNSIAFINYFGTHNNFHIIPIADLLEADEAQKALYRRLIKDRTVIVGSVSPVHRDFQDVPALSFNLFKRQKQEYGVIILANIIDSLLKGASIRRPPPLQEFAGGFLITLAAALVFSLVSPIAGLAAFIALAVALLFVCFIAFVSYGLLLNCFLALASIFTMYAAVSLYKYYSISRESRILMSVLNKYVSPEVAKFITMLEVEQSNSGIKKVITVMFADIRGFTAMSENMDPKEISQLLNEYFNKMTAIIFKNKGTIDKFIGDAIMVLFGAPIDIEDAPLAAVRTALEMTRELKQMSLKWSDKTDQTLEIGIGINTGEAFIGNLGTDRHKEYSALGDTVNTAARLESHAKKGQILISESVLKCVADKIKYGALEPITLRGKSKQQEVFEVTGLKED